MPEMQQLTDLPIIMDDTRRLLQARSYVSSTHSFKPAPQTQIHHISSPQNYLHLAVTPVVPHSVNDIRDSTMQLSNMLLSSSSKRPGSTSHPTSRRESHGDSFIFPQALAGQFIPSSVPSTVPLDSAAASISSRLSLETSGSVDLSASTSTMGPVAGTPGALTPRQGDSPPPSGLTLMMARQGSPARDTLSADESERTSSATPRAPSRELRTEHASDMDVHVQRGRRVLAEQATQPAGAVAVTGSGPDSSPSLLDGAGPDNDIARRQSATSKGSYSRTTASPPPPSDHTPLLLPSTTTVLPSYNAAITESSPPRAFVHGNGRADASTQTKMSRRRSIKKSLARAKHNLRPENLVWGVKEAVGSVPAVLLGTLLNILDGVSCEWSSFSIVTICFILWSNSSTPWIANCLLIL